MRNPCRSVLHACGLGLIVAGSASAQDTVSDIIICNAIIEPAIIVEIYNAETGEPVAEDAQGWVRDGAYADSLSIRGIGDRGVYSLAAGYRPGTYKVHVEKPGVAPWTRDSIKVADGTCGPVTVRLRADLVPVRGYEALADDGNRIGRPVKADQADTASAAGVAPGLPARDRAVESGSVREGLYVICREAFMHHETIELENGHFRHWTRTDILREGVVETGSYTVHGDTVLLHPVREGFAREEEYPAFLAEIGFTPEEIQAFIEETTLFRFRAIHGLPVLWKVGTLKAFEEHG